MVTQCTHDNTTQREEIFIRRSPHEIVDTIAYSLKEGKPGNEYRISDIVKKTFMNHVTVSYYLELIVHIQNNLPKIEYIEKKRNSFVKILKEVELPLSDEEYVLLSLFDKDAFTKSKAAPFFEGSMEIINKLRGSSLLEITTDRVFLLPEGIVMAAGLAEKRAEFVLSSQKHNVIERGEEKIEEWVCRPTNVRIETEPNAQEVFSPVQKIHVYASPVA
ncbi:MAG: hypothetical protein FWF07_01190 [Methanomassiliicoccaceae archaeon]|nr:hypothetical protein [Methanomassiliicoccaceae archaeon]